LAGLKDHFRTAGNVIRADIVGGPDGLSKGVGLVEYSSSQEAAKAIRLFNDSEFQGRLLQVREDKFAGAD